jgi:RNA polymerase sigma-70 factor (ECF subfamily)
MPDREQRRDGDASQPWAALSRYLGRMFLRLGARSHDAEDLAQESLSRVVGPKEGPKCPPSIALATTVGKNLWRDGLRRKVRRGHPEGSETTDSLAGSGETPDEVAAGHDDVRRLREALASLDPRHRDAIVLVILEHKSYAQAAKILGVPRGTVKSRIHYGIQRLRARLTGGEHRIRDDRRACDEEGDAPC